MTCQDPLENYFGQQRAVGARKDNPSICDFGFNNHSIRNQKIFWPIAGNVFGQDIGMVDFTNKALPCCKKPKKLNWCHFLRISLIINFSSIITAILIPAHEKTLAVNNPRRLWKWGHFSFALCILLCAIFQLKYTLSQAVVEYSKCVP